MKNRDRAKRLAVMLMTALAVLTLFLSPARAEYDKTKKMKAEAEYCFERREYYKAIDIWAEVLKIDSYDKDALDGLSKAQKIIEESKGEKERSERQRLRELIQEGKNYYRDREYKKALASWGQALSIDPANKEVLDLIEDARIRAQYQVGILDKLKREKHLKTPYVKDLDGIANKMINLLEKADTKVRKEKAEEIKEEVKKEIEGEIREEKGEIKEEEEKRVEEIERSEAMLVAEMPKKEEPKIEKDIAPSVVASPEGAKQPQKEIASPASSGIVMTEVRPSVSSRNVTAAPSRPRNDKPIIGIIILLAIFLIIKLTATTKIKELIAKAPPKGVRKEEEFEPRDLKKFLKNKNEDRDKDLFK